MNPLDQVFPALTIWREARGEGSEGMAAVAFVIINRMKKRKLTAYEVCVQRMQFSSVTAPGDPELALYPSLSDETFKEAQSIWEGIFNGLIPDPTSGSDFYFNPSVVLPSWAKDYTFIRQIGHHSFYRS